ncbi:MAG: nucleotide exchange factor GrpE [Candidatus Izemoplasmatales bacterium]
MSEKDLEKELFEEKDNESNNEVKEEIENEDSKLKKKKQKKNKLELQLDEIQEELEALKDKYYRNLAEMENYKKRTTNELVKERKYASQSMADKLIDSVEVFTQALNIKTEDKQMQNFLYGFKMIRDMIFNALKDEGVSEIETKIGDTFDPNIHEAMDTVYDPNIEEHSIIKVSKTGYKFKDRVLRPAFVVINVKPNEEENENQNENQKIDEINNEGKDE